MRANLLLQLSIAVKVLSVAAATTALGLFTQVAWRSGRGEARPLFSFPDTRALTPRGLRFYRRGLWCIVAAFVMYFLAWLLEGFYRNGV